MSSELDKIISGLAVKVDEFVFAVVANSIVYKNGKPTRSVKGTELGDVVFSENNEEAVGMLKFDIYATKENIENLDIIEGRSGSTSVFYNNDFRKTMKRGVTTNGDERTLGADGTITVEIMGTKIL